MHMLTDLTTLMRAVAVSGEERFETQYIATQSCLGKGDHTATYLKMALARGPAPHSRVSWPERKSLADTKVV